MKHYGTSKIYQCIVLCLALNILPVFGESSTKKVIIDADPAIGVPFKDVDDGLMLLIALHSPEIDILGITTTYGNVSGETAFRKANELIMLTGRHDVPVLRGADKSDRVGDETDASQFIRQMANDFPGEITILAVGPLTNIATAISGSSTTAANLKGVISMGGNVSAVSAANTQSWWDLNYGLDKEAVGLFLESAANHTIVSIQESERFYISGARYKKLITETRYRDYLSDNTRVWFRIRRRVFVVWDVVALACLVHPEWFSRNDVSISFTTTAMGEPKINVIETDESAVMVNIPIIMEDQQAFWDWFFSRI